MLVCLVVVSVCVVIREMLVRVVSSADEKKKVGVRERVVLWRVKCHF